MMIVMIIVIVVEVQALIIQVVLAIVILDILVLEMITVVGAHLAEALRKQKKRLLQIQENAEE